MGPRSYLAAGRESFPAAHSSEVVPRIPGMRLLGWRALRLQADDVARPAHCDVFSGGGQPLCERRGIVRVERAAYLPRPERSVDHELHAIAPIELLGRCRHGVAFEYQPAVGPR